MYKSEVSSPRGTQQMHRPTFSDLMYSIGKRFQETMMRVSQNLQRSVQMQIESVRVSNSKIVQQLSQELKIISKQANFTKKADYEISNLRNKNEVRQGQEGVINEKLSQIHENIMRIQDNISSNKKQSRQRPFNIKLESITFKEGQERDHIIKKSVSRIISQVFSVGFNLFLKEKVDFDKVKVYCCEQFLYYLTGFITNNGLSCQQIQKIDIHLRNEVIPYLKLNYPYSQQKQACRQLVNRIVEFDRFNENEYDIVYRSGINISQVADDIDKQVMQILNYVIELPQKKITIHPQSNSSKEVNLYTAFQQDFNKIFKKVENRNWTSFFFNLNENLQKQKISNKEDLANLQKNILEKMKLQDDSFKKQAQEYKEKVKSYTHYKIGRKLSSNVEKYSEKQMKEGFLQIKDFAVARVLTKWIQSLEDYFNKSEKSTYERDEPFRLHDGSQIYEFPRVVFTSEFLNKRKKMIKEQMKILTNNLYETIQRTMKDTRNPKFKKLRQTCSDQDATLGHLSKVMVQSGQNYVCNYLKFLLGKVKQLQQQFFDQEQYRLYNNKNFLPALVNFKLGDLMRCLITSNERQIIALYEYLKLQCELQPEVFEMVRVKNRFGGPNKDILLNIFYRKSIMIQIQLAIKNQSSFLACSDKFNHFIYELGRVPFGPINQLCNVWTKYSPKSTFLDKKFRQLNSSSETVPSLCTEGKKHIFAPTNKSSLRLPYWCSLCQVFRTSGPNHETCYLCHKAKRCFSCKKLDCQDLIIKEMFDDYQKFEQNQFPSHGTLFVGFDLSADKVIQRYLIVMDINEVYYLLSAKASSTSTITVQNEQYDSVQLSQFKIQHKVTNLSDINAINKVFMRYLKNYVLFKAKFKVNSHLIQQQTMEKFWIKSRMKTIFKDQKKTFNMQLKSSTMQKSNLMCKIDNQLAQNIQTLIKVEKIILRRDLLQGFPKALANLDNLQYLFIGDNSIAEIDISGMVHLKQLLIGQNLIESVSKIVGLKNAKQLRKIHIGRNRIKNCRGFPILSCLQQFEIISNGMNNFGQDFNFQNYPQLQKINLQKNEITNFDELQKLSEMKKLRSLDISLNLISRTESIPYIPNLQVLHLRKNKLMGVRGVGKLNKLKQLHLNFNRIDQIGQISQLKELEVLTMNYNIHLSNLKGIGSLVKLKRLHLCQNAIYKIDELKNLVNVEEMIICINDITDLSSLAYLKSLKILDASDNKLSDMSKLPTLQALQVLRLNSNQIQSFNGMPKLDRLKKLYLENNKISSLKGMPKLKQLQLLNISTNKIKNFVGMPSLYNLQKLQSNLNHIQSFQDLPALGSLCDLEVRNCGLTNLKGLAKFKHLQILSLSENLQMVQLYDILSLPILQQLSLSLNANSVGLLQTIMESKTLRTLEVVYGKQEKQQKVQKMLNKLQEKGIRVKLIQQD